MPFGDEQEQSAELDIEAKKTANDKAKNPPPVMTPGQQPTNQPGKPVQKAVNKPTNNIAAKSTKDKKQNE